MRLFLASQCERFPPRAASAPLSLKHLCRAPSAHQSHGPKWEKLKGEEELGYSGASPEHPAACPSTDTTPLPTWDRISPLPRALTNAAFVIVMK